MASDPVSHTTRQRSPRAHWAANRQPDIIHRGRAIWRMPHDREHILTEFWYSERGPTSQDGFDVRTLHQYVPYPDKFPWTSGTLEKNIPAIMRYDQAKHKHHAEIIVQAINAGCDLEAITAAHYQVEQQKWDSAKAQRASLADDTDLPF